MTSSNNGVRIQMLTLILTLTLTLFTLSTIMTTLTRTILQPYCTGSMIVQLYPFVGLINVVKCSHVLHVLHNTNYNLVNMANKTRIKDWTHSGYISAFPHPHFTYKITSTDNLCNTSLHFMHLNICTSAFFQRQQTVIWRVSTNVCIGNGNGI